MEGDRAEPEDEAEVRAETTGRDSPDGRKEEAQPQDQAQEEDGTTGNGRGSATLDGMTTAKISRSMTKGRTGANLEKQNQ